MRTRLRCFFAYLERIVIWIRISVRGRAKTRPSEASPKTLAKRPFRPVRGIRRSCHLYHPSGIVIGWCRGCCAPGHCVVLTLRNAEIGYARSARRNLRGSHFGDSVRNLQLKVKRKKLHRAQITATGLYRRINRLYVSGILQNAYGSIKVQITKRRTLSIPCFRSASGRTVYVVVRIKGMVNASASNPVAISPRSSGAVYRGISYSSGEVMRNGGVSRIGRLTAFMGKRQVRSSSKPSIRRLN